MAVTLGKIESTLAEMSRLRKALLAAKKRIKEYGGYMYGCKETGAVKRASMDLSRQLTELRKA